MKYASVSEGRASRGLRVVLTRGGPGPWSEAARGLLAIKRLEHLPVAQIAGEEDEDLREWTGQTAAPVAIWNDEPPQVRMSEIVLLFERLRPDPPLLPSDPEARAWTLGICREISGQQGLGWSRRLLMLDAQLARQPEGPGRDWTVHFCRKYGHDPAALPGARRRVGQILGWLRDEFRAQRARGSAYLVGDALSAADVFWAAFAAMFAPLPEDVCPMSRGLRRMYTATDPEILDALGRELLEHRDRIYADHIGLPLDF